jgi:hypothetical protein
MRHFMRSLSRPPAVARSALLVPLLLAWLLALPARAQTVHGRAVDRETQQPVGNAAVVLVDAEGDAVVSGRTRADGTFRLTAPAAGEYRLTASRIGYRTMLSTVVPLAEGQVVEVEARISPSPVALDTATVRAAAVAGITGRVLEADTDRPIAGATVTLRNGRGHNAGRAVTDDGGRFHLRVPAPGLHELRAERVGYAAAAAPRLTLVPDDTLNVELRMSTGAVVLAPLTVVAASRNLVRDQQLAEFDWRRTHQPWGRFLGPEQVRRINAFHTTDVLQEVPFVQVSGFGSKMVTLRAPYGRGRCIPTVYADGHYVPVSRDNSVNDWISGKTVTAVEVYDRPATAPPEFGPRGSAMNCGVVVIWTRPLGEPRG